MKKYNSISSSTILNKNFDDFNKIYKKSVRADGDRMPSDRFAKYVLLEEISFQISLLLNHGSMQLSKCKGVIMKNQTIIITFVIFFAGIVLSGCSFSKMNLTGNGAYTIERVNTSDRISIRSVKVYQDDGDTVVSGKVKLNKNLFQPKQGHVDIAVISPDGTVLDTASVFYNPRRLTRRMQLKANNGSYFTARFPGPLPQGSIVRLAPHNSIEETVDKIDK